MNLYEAMFTLQGVLIIALACMNIVEARSLRELSKRIDRLENTFPKKP